ncbi:MAG TPA: hypothetical protein VHI31_06505 [Actinomycetota bacterium]|nr:hypothetical protein [Actinomycetota bacterium]
MAGRQGSLATFEEAMALGPEDGAFLSEIAQVMEKYGNLDRFGICLLHEHFPLADDEVLLETHDKELRTHTVEAVRRTDIADPKYTMWKLGAEGTANSLMACAMDKCK